MIEEIKKRIDEKKKDSTAIKKYVKAFCDSEKANELFSKNDEFTNLKDSINKKNKEDKNKKEDEYF